MNWRIINTPSAKLLATKNCPVIAQEIKGIKDFPTGIIMAPPKDVEAVLPSEFLSPTLYYRISQDESYIYAFYMIFHPFDWSDSPLGIIRDLDSHQYDTESVVFRIPTKQGVPIDVITVCHHYFKYKRYEANLPQSYWGKLFIEACGHGIYPWGSNPREFEEKPMLMTYNKKSIELVSLDEHEKHWDRVKFILNEAGVHFPDQQVDWYLRKRNNYPGLSHKPGDMFNRPHILFERAEKENLFA